MNLGLRRVDQYHQATQLAVSVPLSGRMTCSICGLHKSIGQFAKGETACIKCKPQGRNFRRGDIGAGPVANFKENSMLDEQKMLQIIASEPLIRTVQLRDQLDCDMDDLSAVLKRLVGEGHIESHSVLNEGRRATCYQLTDQARGDMLRAAPGLNIDGLGVIERAIEFLADHPGASSSHLHAHLGLAPDVLASTVLRAALDDGRLIKDGKNWLVAGAKMPDAPAQMRPEARATKADKAVRALEAAPNHRISNEEMRRVIDLPTGEQVSPYLKAGLRERRFHKQANEWVLGAEQPRAPLPQPNYPPAVVPVVLGPTPERLLEIERALAPATLPDQTQGIGDVNSQEKGSGARYNNGKPPFELIPAAMIAGSIGMHTPANRAIAILGFWQEGGGQESLLEVVRELGLDGWAECAHVFDYGRKKYAEWNWAKGMKWSVPFACAQRHLLAMVGGEVIDPESGLPHRGHVICNVVMLWTYHRTYLVGDDRPLKELIA